MRTQRKNNHKDRETAGVVFHGVHPATVGTDQRLPFPEKLWSQVVEARVWEFVLCPWFHGRVRLFMPQEWRRLADKLAKVEASVIGLVKFWDFIVQWAERRPVPQAGKMYVPTHIYRSYFGDDMEKRKVFLLGKPGAIDVCRRDIHLTRRDQFLSSDEAESEIMGLLAKTGFFRPFSGAASSEFL
ncbi:MAG: hypothetical protein Q8Q12_19005 [bacterium]|nr:hypothetical protein [bacterium]